MDIYLVTYFFRHEEQLGDGDALVKANRATEAWDRLKSKWEEELKEGKTDVPVSAIYALRVKRICSEKELIL